MARRKDMFGQGEAPRGPDNAPPVDPAGPGRAADPPAPKPARTVQITVGTATCEVRTLDTSDGCREANILLQEVVYHTQYIAAVKSRFFVDTPARRDKSAAFACRALAILLQAGCTPTAAESALGGLTAAFDAELPGGPADLPEPVNTRVFELLARCAESRREAFGKLLTELLVVRDEANRAAVAAVVNQARDDGTLSRILDTVIG